MDKYVTQYSPHELPSVVSEQVKALAEFGKKVQKCRDAAEKAKDSSDEALRHHVKWFGMSGKQEAIEYLQKSAIEMTRSQISTAEALKSAFEYQQRLAAVAQYLVNLGLSSIEHNRKTVQVLESKLRFASLRGINAVAKEEIKNIVKDLKSQRDLQCKVDEKIEHVAFLQNKVQKDLAQITKDQKSVFLHSQYYNYFILILVLAGVLLSVYTTIITMTAR